MNHYPGENLLAVADDATSLGLELFERQPFHYSEFDLPATDGLFFHMHYVMELGIVTEGAMERIFPDRRGTLRKGDTWLTSLLEPHWWRVSQRGTRIAVFHFLPEFLATLHFAEAPDLKLMAPFTVSPSARPRSGGPCCC